MPLQRGAHEVLDVEGGLAEEIVAALLLQHHEAALDGADGRRGDVAVFGGELLAAVAQVLEQRAQVLEVEKGEAFLVGELEGDVEGALLRVRQAHEAREHQRAHVGDGGADRVALLAEQVPEDGRDRLEAIVVEAHRLGALEQEVLGLALHGDAGEIALHVGGEDRNARVAEAFGHDLQRHRLAGAGGAGDQAVAVGHGEEQLLALVALAEEDRVVGHVAESPDNSLRSALSCYKKPDFAMSEQD